jgi:hypothetical protein
MDKVASRGVELEAAAAARLDQFRGLAATRGLPNVNDGPLALTPSNVDQVKIAAAAERAVADELRVEDDEAHRPRSGRAIALVRSEKRPWTALRQVLTLSLRAGAAVAPPVGELRKR